MLFESLQKINALPGRLLARPGHYMDWREAGDDLVFAAPLAQVVAVNREIYKCLTLARFVAFIKENMRPQPEEYAVIRRVNANLEGVDGGRAEELDLGKNECAASLHAKQRGRPD